MAEENKNPRQLNIEIPADLANGVYANFVIIGHSQAEFVADFISMLPTPVSKPQVCSRVIMSPQHAKRLMMALQENIRKYEASFGVIALPDTGNTPPDFPPPNFGGPAGIA